MPPSDFEAHYPESRRVNEYLPPSYGNCQCRCHVDPCVKHVAPCCYPRLPGELETHISGGPWLPPLPAELEVQPQCGCGFLMSKNPHPDAGLPGKSLEVGAEWMCLPCTQRVLHEACKRKDAAEKIARFYFRADDITFVDECWLRTSLGAVADSSGCYLVLPVPGGDPDNPSYLEWLLDDSMPGKVHPVSIAGTDVGQTIQTRGQVRRLLQALGIKSDANWPSLETSDAHSILCAQHADAD